MCSWLLQRWQWALPGPLCALWVQRSVWWVWRKDREVPGKEHTQPLTFIMASWLQVHSRHPPTHKNKKWLLQPSWLQCEPQFSQSRPLTIIWGPIALCSSPLQNHYLIWLPDFLLRSPSSSLLSVMGGWAFTQDWACVCNVNMDPHPSGSKPNGHKFQRKL